MNSLWAKHELRAVDFLSVKRRLAVCVAGVVMAGVAGCTAFQPRPAEEVVKERAQARWDALVKGDTKTAYTFFSPGSRAVLTPEGWASTLRLGFWKSAEVEKVTCRLQDACDVQVRIEYEFQGRRTKTPLGETWIKEGSDWWYVQK